MQVFARPIAFFVLAVVGGMFSPGLATAAAPAGDQDAPLVLGTALFDRACLVFARGNAENDATAKHLGTLLFGRAIPYLERARAESHFDKELLNDLAAAYSATGEYRKELDVLRIAFRKYPDDATLAFNLGMAMLDNELVAEAKRQVITVKKLDPARAALLEKATATHVPRSAR